MTLLQRKLFTVQSGLFKETEYGELYPAYTDLTDDLKKQYRFIGQVLGRCILTHQLCEARFSPFFLNLVRIIRYDFIIASQVSFYIQ